MKNREIKFRVYHQRDGMRYFGDIPVFILLNGDFFYDDCFGNIKAEYRINDSHKIMQYTGLQDKNGKDIYEGDLFKASEELGHIYEVFHNKYGWAVRAYTNYGFDELNLINDLLSNYEIAGNICQNKELIPNKKTAV
jgi:uncharacterized phage protein (TIGR01671 family)